ncbi:MAG: ribonuclease III [Chlamydiota bacterium]
MNELEKLLQAAPHIEALINYTFKDKHLLILAFTHRSYLNENRQVTQEHNERLEFLGDSVLSLLIVEHLYRRLPDTPEGQLSNLRSKLVEASSCSYYLSNLGLDKYILMSKGERRSLGKGRQSILADLFEAIIGAIYLDGGLEASRRFLFHNFDEHIETIIATPTHNWKAELQDYSQKKYKQTPVYKVIKEEGPDHDKLFVVEVEINEKPVGTGLGSSKKEAQQAAAATAFEHLKS